MRDRSTTSLRPYGQVLAVYLCGLFAFVDLYSMQPLLPLLRRVFRVSESGAGFIISASSLGVAASAALLAIFAERLNRKRLIVGSMGALALCTVVTSTVSSLPALGALRVLQGLVTPGIFTVTIAYITEEWPAVLVPRVMSLYVAGTVSGGFLGRLCGGLIGARYGWRAVFLTLGVLGFCGMALTQRLPPPALTRPIPGKRAGLVLSWAIYAILFYWRHLPSASACSSRWSHSSATSPSIWWHLLSASRPMHSAGYSPSISAASWQPLRPVTCLFASDCGVACWPPSPCVSLAWPSPSFHRCGS